MIWFQIQFNMRILSLKLTQQITNFWVFIVYSLAIPTQFFAYHPPMARNLWTTELWTVHPWLQQMLMVPPKENWYIRGQKKTEKSDRWPFICEPPWQIFTKENDFCWPCLWPDCLNSLSSISGLFICVILLILPQWKQQKNLHNSFSHIPKGIWKTDFPR